MKTHLLTSHTCSGWLMAAFLALGATARSADTPSLKEALKDHFQVGTAVNRAITTGRAFRRTSEQVNQDIALVKAQFNQLVAENDMKWALIHPREGADGYDFGPADALVNFGVSNQMSLAGHTLVWHAQTPNWVFAGTNPPPSVLGAASGPVPNTTAPGTSGVGPGRFGRGFGPYNGPRASRAELLERMRDHIHTVVGRYKGRIQVWDVVNEAVADGGTNILRNSLWLQIIGPDFIAKAFEYAHEADPKAILRYNDYGLENPAKRRKLITLIQSLQEQKVPVMAIGSQAHVNVSTSFEVMDQALTELETLGLPIHITEFDVNSAQGGQRSTGADIANSAATTQGGLVEDANRRQAEAYAGLFRAFLKHDQHVKMVTFWGANDANSWRASGRPLLFDGDNLPKPAFHAVIAEVKKAAAALDWPQFRGPTGDGISSATNVPLTWSPTQNVKWKTAVPGRGRSSPVILGNRVWLTTAVETDVRTFAAGPDRMQQAERVVIGVVCLDRATGKQLYYTELFPVDDPPAVNFLNSYATPTPVVEPGRLYCDFGTFGTACLDSDSGEVLWKRQLPLNHQQGPGSSPAPHQNLLILVRDGTDQQYVTALDKQTGGTVWKTDRPPLRTPVPVFRKSFSTPLVFEAAGKVQMVVPGAQWFVSYQPETGNEIWRVDNGKGETVAPRPVYGGGLVYVSTGVFSGKAQLWAVRVDGQGDVTSTHVAWKLPSSIGFMASPLLLGRELYLLSDDGFVTCVAAQTGEILGKARIGGNYAASPVYAEGRIYCFGREGKTVVLRADRELAILAENELDGPVFASPALLDSAIYLRTDSSLYCLTSDLSTRP